MNISNFSTIFQIYVGINFGYAILESTRPDFFNLVSDRKVKLNTLKKNYAPPVVPRGANQININEAEAQEFMAIANNLSIGRNLVHELEKEFIIYSNPDFIIKSSILGGFMSFIFLLFIGFGVWIKIQTF